MLRVSRSLYCRYCGPWEEREEGLNSQLGLQDRLSAGARTALLLVITACVLCMYISSNRKTDDCDSFGVVVQQYQQW